MFSPSQERSVYELINEQGLPGIDFNLRNGSELRLVHKYTGFYIRVVPTQMKIANPLHVHEIVVRLLVYSIPSQEGAVLTTKKENVSSLFERWESTIGAFRQWLGWIKVQYYTLGTGVSLEFNGNDDNELIGPSHDSSILTHLHPTIQQTAGSLLTSNHYPQAIHAACTALEKAIQAKSGQSASITGTALLGKAFPKDNPLISLSDDQGEREGYGFLYRGLLQAIRNHYAHNLTEIPAPRALEWLGFISALFYKLDEV